jgi:lathosterol oxidase
MQAVVELKRLLVPWRSSSTYAVNLQLCFLEYALVNSAWCTAQRRWPARPVLARQVRASLAAMPWYAVLPTAVEGMAARGWTRLHGGAFSLSETCAFLVVVEALVYVVHRALHELPWLYRVIHRRHHEYKSAAELSPFASMAFMPLDGLAQASPYAAVAMVMPCHAAVWQALLFFTGVWSTSIHDTASWGVPGVRGAQHHTLHHTRCRCNYGQFTQAFDWLGGTLRHRAPPSRVGLATNQEPGP